MSDRKVVHRSTPLFAALAVIAMLAAAVAAADLRDDDKDWKLLGETVVRRGADKDEIHVGADEGAFKRIKLEVRGADIEIFKLKVVYSNGADDDLEVKQKINKGGQTRAIDLRGDNRSIRRVVLFYKTDAGEDRKARVILFGWK